MTNRHFQNNRNYIRLVERVCNQVRRSRRILRCSGLTLASMSPTTDHVQSVAQRKAWADGLGFCPLEDFQRCVAALWRWNRRTGTHQWGDWNLQQEADGYPVQRDLLEAANGTQGMVWLRRAEQGDCFLAGADGFYALGQVVEDNPAGMATIRLPWHWIVEGAQEEAASDTVVSKRS